MASVPTTSEKDAQHSTSPPTPHHQNDPESSASSISLEKDVAIGLVGEHAQDIDAEVEARVLKKIDWFLIPAMIVGALHSSYLHLHIMPVLRHYD
jgi:hypothetical protein